MHGYTFHGTRVNAQSTACAFVFDHGVHLFRSSNNCVDRTGLNAQRTADAFCLYYESLLGRMRWTALRVEGERRLIK